MIAWFLIAIATIAFFAYIAVVGIDTVNVTGDAVARSESVSRLNTVAGMLVAKSVTADDGSIYLPAPDVDSSGVSIVPASLGTQAGSGFGSIAVYCPFGGAGATSDGSATVRMPSGSNYAIGTMTRNNGRYVVTGRPAYAGVAANPNLLGFVVVPMRRNGGRIGCDSVYQSGSDYLATGAIVRPIMRDGAADANRVMRVAGATLYAGVDGRGDGSSPSSPMTLTTALTYWRTHATAELTIVLGAGTHYIPSGAMNASSDYVDHPAKSRLILAASPSTAPVIAFQSKNTVAPPVDLSLNAVSLQAETLIDGGRRLDLVNGSIGRLRVINGSEVNVNGTVTVSDYDTSGAAYLISLERDSRLNVGGSSTYTGGTTFNVDYNSLQNGINVADRSYLSARSFIISFKARTGTGHERDVHIDPQATASFRTGRINVFGRPTYSFYNYGTLDLIETNINFTMGSDVAIVAFSGMAETTLWSSVIGGSSLANIGIANFGGRAMRGFGSVVYSRPGNPCWFDYYLDSTNNGSRLFAYSTNGVIDNDNGSGVSVNEGLPGMSPTPTSSQVIAYQAAITRNNDRDILRSRNTSSWHCRHI